MSENLKKLLEMISKNEELTAKISDMEKEELLVLAKEWGLELTEADLEMPVEQELNDDDLDIVTGGKCGCACSMGGGGTKDANDKSCACVVAGLGYDYRGAERCTCDYAGSGIDT